MKKIISTLTILFDFSGSLKFLCSTFSFAHIKLSLMILLCLLQGLPDIASGSSPGFRFINAEFTVDVGQSCHDKLSQIIHTGFRFKEDSDPAFITRVIDAYCEVVEKGGISSFGLGGFQITEDSMIKNMTFEYGFFVEAISSNHNTEFGTWDARLYLGNGISRAYSTLRVGSGFTDTEEACNEFRRYIENEAERLGITLPYDIKYGSVGGIYFQL